MQIRPILSAMWRNKTGSILVAVQIALTLAIVVNSLFLAMERSEFIGRPTGIDVENIFTLTSTGFGSDYDHDATIATDLRDLKAIPGVIGAISANHIPLSGSGNGTGFRASMDDEATNVSGNAFRFSDGVEDALGVKIIAGRGFRPEEIRATTAEDFGDFPKRVVISQALAEQLYPDKPALGEFIYNNLGEGAEIIGIVELMFGSWVSWNNVMNVAWFPSVSEATFTRYIVRTAPGERDSAMLAAEKLLADGNRTRLVRNVTPLAEMAARSYQGDRAVAVVLIAAIVLLLIITGLGIVGLASFTVRQRTKQIGTRRAIGARKRDIIIYFLTENWLMTTIGILIGTVLAIALNMLLADLFELARLNYLYLIAGIGMLWLLGFAAVFGPARRAAQVSPAIASRTV